MSKPTAQPTRGSRALSEGRGAEQIARDLKCAVATAYGYANGNQRMPKARREIAQELYDIPLAWWDEPLTTSTPPPPAAGLLAALGRPREPPPPEAAVEVEGQALDRDEEIRALLRTVRDFRKIVEKDPVATMKEKARYIQVAVQAALALGRLTGAASEMPVSKLLNTPAFRRVVEVLATSLEAHPAAARAVATALEGLS